jgi:hypothetical protein
MTMHLVQGMSSLNTKKKKSKLTDAKVRQLETEWRQYNKRMRKLGCHDAQFDKFEDYIAYCMGKYKPKLKGVDKDYEPTQTYRRETPHYPSLGDGIGNGLAKETPKYTGDEIMGIATMHKSNAVPIRKSDKQGAVDIANMRR